MMKKAKRRVRLAVEFKSKWILRKEAWCCGQSQRQGKGGQRGEGVK